MGMSRDGQTPHRWDNTYALMCTATLPRGLLPLFLASEAGEIKGANARVQGQPLPLRLPTLGVLGEVRGRALEPLFTQGQAPESRDQSPLAVVTQDVCARACKCGCMCVRSLRISLGIFRVGLEEVGNRRMSSSVSSGGRNQEARPVGP